MAQAVLGIPIEHDMINVVNLKPGESAPFLFYTIHFVDLQNPIGFDEEQIKKIIKETRPICNRGSLGNLPLSYMEKSLARSRYMLVAINNGPISIKFGMSLGSIVLAVPDHDDPEGIYVHASCNTTSANLRGTNPLFQQMHDKVTLEVDDLKDEEIILEYYNKRIPGLKAINMPITPVDRKGYKEMLVSGRLNALKINKVIWFNVSLRTAQLLKLTLFNYCNTYLNIKHAYNSAAVVDAAMLHARNGMTLKTAKCNQPDQLAERFNSLSTDKKRQLIESGTLKKDSSGSYPMKLCNYNFNVLLANLLTHTINAIQKLEQEGFTMDDILAVDIII